MLVEKQLKRTEYLWLSLQSKAYKILKSSKNFGITINTRISILK
jgi:hypothetical protein